VSERDLSYKDLLEIIQLVESSPEFSEFKLEYGDIKIHLRKNSAEFTSKYESLDSELLTSAKEATQMVEQITLDSEEKTAIKKTIVSSVPDGMVGIKSPMVGSFYRSPEPGASPFVEVGSIVNPESVVCIIEVMKLMNSLPAGVSGTVADILVSDGDPVEYGQVLILIKPN
jgi:acetyl-CoA carboxylase biotin carboxyl carrier protein